MGSFRKILNFTSSHSPSFIILLFFLTRLINLTLLPIYADEANYLDWGWRSIHLPGFLYYSLYDAKQPLLIWLFGISESLITNPLLAGRLISIIAGLICLIGIYKLTARIFDTKTGLLASLLYVVTPLFLFFDRQVLMETAIAAVGIWSLYFLIKFLSLPSLSTTITFGLTLSLGVWIKNSALLFLISALIIIGLQFINQKTHRYLLLTHTLLCLTVFSLSLSPLFFQPTFWASFNLNSRYSISLSEMLQFPIGNWFRNFMGILDIAFFFTTPLVFISALYGIFKQASKNKVLLLWFILPLIQVLLTTRTLNIRYPASFLVPLIIFSAVAIRQKLIFLPIISLLPIIISTIQIFNPPAYFQLLSRVSAYSYASDYVTGNLTGYLVNDIYSHIKSAYPNQPLYVTFAVNSGNFEAALIDYFHTDPFIKTSYLDSRLLPEEIFQYDCLIAPEQLIFISREYQTAGLEKYLTEITRVSPSHGNDFATIYSLKNTDCQNPITINPTIQ